MITWEFFTYQKGQGWYSCTIHFKKIHTYDFTWNDSHIFPHVFFHIFISTHLIFSNDSFLSTFSACGFIFHNWSYLIPMMPHVKFKNAFSGHNMLKCTSTFFFHVITYYSDMEETPTNKHTSSWRIFFERFIYRKSNKIQNLPISKPNLNFSHNLSVISVKTCPVPI